MEEKVISMCNTEEAILEAKRDTVHGILTLMLISDFTGYDPCDFGDALIEVHDKMVPGIDKIIEEDTDNEILDMREDMLRLKEALLKFMKELEKEE